MKTYRSVGSSVPAVNYRRRSCRARKTIRFTFVPLLTIPDGYVHINTRTPTEGIDGRGESAGALKTISLNLMERKKEKKKKRTRRKKRTVRVIVLLSVARSPFSRSFGNLRCLRAAARTRGSDVDDVQVAADDLTLTDNVDLLFRRRVANDITAAI